MQRICEAMRTIVLRTIYRTSDPALLAFLSECRVEQPQKSTLSGFFRGRTLGPSLDTVARLGLEYGRRHGVMFSWLCVTNAGADRVNAAALRLLGIDDKDENLWYGDPKVNSGRINATIGVVLRPTRNLDKARGFVNGAVGEIYAKLGDSAFILKISSGTMVLVHPGWVGGRPVLPCAYGYATTIRKSQGASLAAGCLFFDHSYPAERGYGYVGASRFRNKEGMFYYGTIRRSDWLPRNARADQQLERSMDSDSEDSQDAEMEANYESSEEDDSVDGDLGRLCRGAGMTDVAIAEGSDSDEELCGLGAMSGQQSQASYVPDDMRALQALTTPESAAAMD